MANIVGTWKVETDWNCDGDDGNPLGPFNLTFDKDGLVKYYAKPLGKWFQVGDTVIWLLDGIPVTYCATVHGGRLLGVMGWAITNGDKGCFSGKRSSDVAPVASPPSSGIDPLTNKKIEKD